MQRRDSSARGILMRWKARFRHVFRCRRQKFALAVRRLTIDFHHLHLLQQMTDKEKRRFQEMAEKDKERYENEMQHYQPPDGQGKGRPKKRKKPKDPDAPKRAL